MVDTRNSSLSRAKTNKEDEFYTQLEDVEQELITMLQDPEVRKRYFAIADIHGNKIHASVNVKKDTVRIQARSGIMSAQFLPMPKGRGFLGGI